MPSFYIIESESIKPLHWDHRRNRVIKEAYVDLNLGQHASNDPKVITYTFETVSARTYGTDLSKLFIYLQVLLNNNISDVFSINVRSITSSGFSIHVYELTPGMPGWNYDLHAMCHIIQMR